MQQLNTPGAGLPDFVKLRMEKLGMRASLRTLAAASGVSLGTLQRGLSGQNEMGVITAKKIAATLKLSIDELVTECGLA